MPDDAHVLGVLRASERRFYQKVLDIYATSIDYQLDTDLSSP